MSGFVSVGASPLCHSAKKKCRLFRLGSGSCALGVSSPAPLCVRVSLRCSPSSVAQSSFPRSFPCSRLSNLRAKPQIPASKLTKSTGTTRSPEPNVVRMSASTTELTTASTTQPSAKGRNGSDPSAGPTTRSTVPLGSPCENTGAVSRQRGPLVKRQKEVLRYSFSE